MLLRHLLALYCSTVLAKYFNLTDVTKSDDVQLARVAQPTQLNTTELHNDTPVVYGNHLRKRREAETSAWKNSSYIEQRSWRVARSPEAAGDKARNRQRGTSGAVDHGNRKGNGKNGTGGGKRSKGRAGEERIGGTKSKPGAAVSKGKDGGGGKGAAGRTRDSAGKENTNRATRKGKGEGKASRAKENDRRREKTGSDSTGRSSSTAVSKANKGGQLGTRRRKGSNKTKSIKA